MLRGCSAGRSNKPYSALFFCPELIAWEFDDDGDPHATAIFRRI